MRRIFFSFLMLVMFASAIVCGCGPEAQAAQTGVSHHHSEQADTDHHHGKGSLEQDCQKSDMQLPGHVSVEKPDLSKYSYLVFALADEQPVWAYRFEGGSGIRGPPWPYDPANNQPSILLTSQRLRI